MRELLRFHVRLIAARRRSGLSQRAVALAIHLDAAQLSRLELGKRPAPEEPLIARLASTLGLSQAESADLRWAAAHDKVMLALRSARLIEAGRLVSVALVASRVLGRRELAGLVRYIEEAIASQERINQLAEKAADADTEEVTMP